MCRKNIRALEAWTTEEQKIKKRKILLKELELGVWTPAEYRDEVKKLDRPAEVTSTPDAEPQSPHWEIENGGDLPNNSDDL